MGAERKTRARGRPRGGMLVEERQQFGRLIEQGVGPCEACRIVGISRRTGTRWRFGHIIRNSAGEAVHYPPVSLAAPKPRHPRYLSLEERATIADLNRAGVGVCAIAEELSRAPSTVSRELRCNADGQSRYLPATAERHAVERRSRPSRTRRIARDEQLCGVVVDLLDKRWSPEQVAHELPVRFPDQPERHLCTESIYPDRCDPPCQTAAPAAPTSGSGPRTPWSTHRYDDDR